eukprot:m.41272 g.41272  ORF g.41272 m.41272 type:complete len:399 (+) comp8191_c0_seq1:194-1390(+)
MAFPPNPQLPNWVVYRRSGLGTPPPAAWREDRLPARGTTHGTTHASSHSSRTRTSLGPSLAQTDGDGRISYSNDPNDIATTHHPSGDASLTPFPSPVVWRDSDNASTIPPATERSVSPPSGTADTADDARDEWSAPSPPPPPGFRDNPETSDNVEEARGTSPVLRRLARLNKLGPGPLSEAISADELKALAEAPPSTLPSPAVPTTSTATLPDPPAANTTSPHFSFAAPSDPPVVTAIDAAAAGTAISTAAVTGSVEPPLRRKPVIDVPPWPTRSSIYSEASNSPRRSGSSRNSDNSQNSQLYDAALLQSAQLDVLFERASAAQRKARASVAKTLASLTRERAIQLGTIREVSVVPTESRVSSASDEVVVRRPRKTLPRAPRVTSVRWRPSQFAAMVA